MKVSRRSIALLLATIATLPAAHAVELSVSASHARPGDTVRVVITGAMPNAPIVLGAAAETSPGATCAPNLQGACVDLVEPVQILRRGRADAAGEAAFDLGIPALPDGVYGLQAAELRGTSPAELSALRTVWVSPGTGLATVTVITASPDALVMTADASGTYLQTFEVDAAGEATVVLPSGGAVTSATFAHTNATELKSIVGVRHGDILTLAPEPVLPAGTLTLTLDDPAGLGDTYRITLGNQSATFAAAALPASRTFALSSDDLNPDGTLDVVAVARDAAGAIAYASATDVVLQGTAPNGVASVALSSFQVNPGQIEVTLDHVGAATEDFAVQQGATRRGRFGEFDGVYPALSPGASASLTMPADAAFHTSTQAFVSRLGFVGQGEVYASLAIPLGPPPASGQAASLSVSSAELPAHLTAVVADLQAMTFAHGLPAGATCAGAAFEEMVVQADASAAGTWHRWSLLAPYAHTARAPELDPALVSTYWPTLVAGDYSLRLRHTPEHTYDQLRQAADPFLASAYLAMQDGLTEAICVTERDDEL